MKTYTINHGLNCDDKYLLIYFLTFKKCFKQYVGEPTVIFHKKWNIAKIIRRSFLGEKDIQRHSKTFKAFKDTLAKSRAHWLHRGCLRDIN